MAHAPVLNHPQRFSLQFREVAKILRKQNGAQIRDVEATRLTGRDQPVVSERIKDGRVAVG